LSDVPAEPRHRQPVMYVRGVEQRDEHVDVEQSAHQRPSRSRSSSTSSLETTLSPAANGSTALTPRQFLHGREDVVCNVERGAHR
jgi:hypothetical protein